jgi:L-iditol 2-dehydrogenase
MHNKLGLGAKEVSQGLTPRVQIGWDRGQGERIKEMMQELMNAAVLYGKEDLRVEQVAIPAPGPGEILVRVGAALTCGTDLKVYRRGYHAKMLKPPMPFGHELAGTVAAVGEGVDEFAVGDRVVPLNSAPCGICYWCKRAQPNLCEDLLFNNGAYAEYLLVPARIVAKNTLRVPDGLDLEYVALTEPLACVVRGLEESGAQAGDSMIVIGAGPIGLMFMHAAELAGVDVTAVVKRAEQAETAKRFGARQVLSIEGLNGAEEIVAAARRLTPDERGADIVIEAVATPATWEWAVGMVRKGGLVNFFGGPPSGTVVALDTNRLHYGDITLKASFHHTPATCRTAFGLIASGRFKSAEFITGEASLEDVPEVFRGMLTRSVTNGQRDIKTVILMGAGR